MITLAVSTLIVISGAALLQAHLCDNVFRQADKLIVKPETYNLTVKDKAEFKVFLQNNMDRAIAEISLIAESPAFDFEVTPKSMSVPTDRKVYFLVTMTPKQGTKTGNYPINFRLVGGGRQFKSFSLNMPAEHDPPKDTVATAAPASEKKSEKEQPAKSSLLNMRRTGSKPTINGILNEHAWKEAAVASNFSSSDGGQAAHQTIALLMYDDRFIYFGIYCCDDDTDALTDGDKVKVKFSTTRGEDALYAMIFPAVGSPFYEKAIKKGESPAWSLRGIEYCITNDKESWSVEAAVPLSALGARPPTAAERWFLRIERDKVNAGAEKSYWAGDDAGYNRTEKMGEILVVP